MMDFGGADEDMEPIALPAHCVWEDLQHIAVYVQMCLSELGLRRWSFCWDRAVRRMGCCNITRAQISLSRYFAEAYLKKDPEMIRHTILHELAHALAVDNYGETGHGIVWYMYCLRLGLHNPTVRCKCEDFTPAHFQRRTTRYVLCHRETGEIFRRYKAKPRKNAARLQRTYIRGRKEETLGKLVIRRIDDDGL
ncbi:MAG: SprT-like domain-containing protein [Akkermansia sp.]|nr:SprT-like domain-containing protein [Akkermansia sp.]